MECESCRLKFNTDTRRPRLLPSCGHSLCEECLEWRLIRGTVACPNCGVSSDSAQHFPPNCSLMETLPLSDACPLHLKPLELFCCSDNALLCAACMLSASHSTHEVLTVKDAYVRQSRKITSLLETARRTEIAVSREKSALANSLNRIQTTYNRLEFEFSHLYTSLVTDLQDRSDTALTALYTAFKAEEISLQSKLAIYEEQEQQIKAFKQSASQELTPTEFLEHFDNLHSLGRRVSVPYSQPPKLDPFLNFSLQKESDAVLKVIKRTYLACVKHCASILMSPRKTVSAEPVQPTAYYSAANTTEKAASLVAFGAAASQVYNTQTCQWSLGSRKLDQRKGYAHIDYNGKTLLMGGKENTLILKSSLLYNSSEDSWASSTFCLPTPRCNFIAATDYAHLYVYGGNTKVISNQLFSFDGTKWTALAGMQERRDELGGCIGPDGRCYAIGGFGGDCFTYLRSAEAYSQTKWESLPDLPEPVSQLAAVSSADSVYVLGGYNGRTALSSCYRFDPRAGKWDTLAPLSVGRSGIAVGCDLQFLYAVGGFGETAVSTVERLFLATGEWEVLPSLLTNEWHQGLVLR